MLLKEAAPFLLVTLLRTGHETSDCAHVAVFQTNAKLSYCMWVIWFDDLLEGSKEEAFPTGCLHSVLNMYS